MKARILLALVALVVLTGVGACWLLAFAPVASRNGEELPFDAVVWRRDSAAAFERATYEEIYQATRDRMVADLLRQHELVGKTRDEVRELLGDPDSVEMFPDWDMVYWLGPDHRGPYGHLDSKWLGVRCSEDGRVAQCRVMTD